MKFTLAAVLLAIPAVFGFAPRASGTWSRTQGRNGDVSCVFPRLPGGMSAPRSTLTCLALRSQDGHGEPHAEAA
eukprot:scaffold770_cov255-Pinguiococcus_pyrenoidosus.AAC.65